MSTNVQEYQSTSLRIQVNGDTIADLSAIAARLQRPIEHVASLRLRDGVRLLPKEGGRCVVLTGADLETLETILGGGSVLHGPDLTKKVERLAGISFEHSRLPFSPNQLEQLQERAERQGQTVQQLIDRAAPRIYEQFFNLIG